MIDGLGDVGMGAREVVGADALVDYLPVRDPLEALVGTMGTDLSKG